MTDARDRELLAGAEIGGDKGSLREPEKLLIPAGAVNWLLMKAFQTPEGDAWMRGFITAHGEPSWIVANQWGLQAKDADIIKVPRQPGANGQAPQMG